MDSKFYATSKTIIVNVLAIAGCGATYWIGWEPGSVALLSTGVVAAANIILRIITKQPISWSRVAATAPELVKDVLARDVAGVVADLQTMSADSEKVDAQ